MRIDVLSAASFSVLRRNFGSARFSPKNFAKRVRDYVDNLIAQIGLRKCGFAGQKNCRETLKYLGSERPVASLRIEKNIILPPKYPRSSPELLAKLWHPNRSLTAELCKNAALGLLQHDQQPCKIAYHFN